MVKKPSTKVGGFFWALFCPKIVAVDKIWQHIIATIKHKSDFVYQNIEVNKISLSNFTFYLQSFHISINSFLSICAFKRSIFLIYFLLVR